MNCQEIDQHQLTPTLPMLQKIARSYPEPVLLPSSLEEAKFFCTREENL